MLDKIRKKIDLVDKNLIELLNERAKLSLEVGKLKHGNKINIYHPNRQKEILNNLTKINDGPLKKGHIENIYTEIFSSSLDLQRKLKIAFLGPNATNTHSAALKTFGHSVEYETYRNIPDIFSSVENGECDYGVVPVENSNEGIVANTLDKLSNSSLIIVSEVMMPISHYLLSKESRVTQITNLYSHPQAISQCSIWINNNLPGVKIFEVSSTSEAAVIAIKKKGSAAIASLIASEFYNLKVLAQNVQNSSDNTTRFFVIGKDTIKKVSKKINYKTSIMCGIRDKPGGLFDLLQPLAKNGVNMTKIESRPNKKVAWEYLFFIDIEGSVSEEKIQKTLNLIKKESAHFKILGSYPSA